MLATIRRWRTWLFNTTVTVLLAVGEMLIALDTGFNWREVLPPQYVPWAIVTFALVNVWMRPRPAVLPTDPEVQP